MWFVCVWLFMLSLMIISLVILIHTLNVDKEVSRFNPSESVDKSVDKKHTVSTSSELTYAYLNNT